MNTYVVLLRGINVGGKSKVAMSELKNCLEDLGYTNVSTYIASGNVILDTKESVTTATHKIADAIVKRFKLESPLFKILILTKAQLENVISGAPRGFGKHPGEYHSDAVFLIGKPSSELMGQLELNPEVDAAWEGDGVVYFQRLSAKRTKSKMSKIVGKPIYPYLTIRNWNTATKLLDLLSVRT